MTFARLTTLLSLAAAAASLHAAGSEENAWPAYVLEKDAAGQTESWNAAGPLAFFGPEPGTDQGTVEGFRPFYVRSTDATCVKTDILYPLFFYRQYPDNYTWSILQLINGKGLNANAAKAAGPKDQHFDLWPFYFSHETDDPDESYHALLPIYGNIKYRLGYQRLFWAPFPLYVQTVKHGTQTTYVPWPIVRIVTGDSHGFGIWPLFGSTHGPGGSYSNFYLWPLGWNNAVEPGPQEPEGSPLTYHRAFLPFFSSDSGPGLESRTYLWPFFGYTEQASPLRYSERRYFWPFLVQGTGDGRRLERWAPFYTRSTSRFSESTWVVWPLWHRVSWNDGDVAQSKTQFFYFVYWSLDQRSDTNPAAAPAYKTHLWPLVSAWDNGAGSRQVQIPSPLEVFFNDNPDMRQTWTPLFSLFRYDHRPDGEARTSLLWGALSWRRDDRNGLREFHAGPLVGMRRGPAGDRWTILGFDFGANPGNHGQPIR